MSKSKFSSAFKIKISEEYLAGHESSETIAKRNHINAFTVRTWASKYKEHGSSAFPEKTGNASYTSQFKTMCVEEVISGHASVDDTVAKYNISARIVLQRWIKRYNANRTLEDYIPQREVYSAMAKRRTTIEERKEIVEYCLEHGKDYKGTAKLYDVSYSQVYTWVKKYDTNGEAGLLDKRGHHKTDDEVDELERLRRENLRLKQQLKESNMLNLLLKKVKEFERM